MKARDLTAEEKYIRVFHNQAQAMFERAASKPELDKYNTSFREIFYMAEIGEVDGVESRAISKAIDKNVSELILQHYIAVIVTTLVNSGHTLILQQEQFTYLLNGCSFN